MYLILSLKPAHSRRRYSFYSIVYSGHLTTLLYLFMINLPLNRRGYRVNVPIKVASLPKESFFKIDERCVCGEGFELGESLWLNEDMFCYCGCIL